MTHRSPEYSPSIQRQYGMSDSGSRGVMSLNRYAARRDQNEPELLETAKKLGWLMIYIGFPVDYVGCFRQRLHFIELKTPKGKYTPAQILFLEEARAHGITVLTWRDHVDIVESSK